MVVEQTDAVRAYKSAVVLAAGFQYLFLKLRSLLCFLAEACRDDDECLHLFCLRQHFYGVGTHWCGNYKHSEFRWRQLADVVKHLYALYLVLLWVDDAQCSLVASVKDVSHYGSSRLVVVVGATYNYNRFRL